MKSMRYRSFSILFCLLFSFVACKQVPETHCINLRCMDLDNPSGVTDKPYFGWSIDNPKDGVTQSAYQILVASSPDLLNESSADLWNSGKVPSGSQSHIYYEGKPLSSANRYYWTVKSWDQDGEACGLSKPATFDVGLINNKDWAGSKWIKRPSNGKENYTYFRKNYSIKKKVSRAMAYVSAGHDFELYLDGKLVGKGPGYHYPQYQYYKTFDITDGLKSTNEHVFACNTHWYGPGQGRPKNSNGLILKAVIEYADGSQEVMGSDASWKQKEIASFLPSQKSRKPGEGVGYVDKIDSRLLLANWNQMTYDDSDWEPSVEIGAHPVAPWTGELQPNLARLFEQEIKPVAVEKVAADTYVIDFGKVYAGVPKIQFSGGTAGAEVSMLGGYALKADGWVDMSMSQGTDLSYQFILNGKEALFQPMVYMGMRYLQVTGSPMALTKDNVAFISRHFELDNSRSAFKSSNKTLNQVWNLMKHSLVVGSQESFVDTPTREKGGFLGDSWSIGLAAMATMGERVMNRRIMEEFLDSQDQYWEDGRFNAVYPNGDGARDIPDYTLMYLVWVWDYYLMTGDKQFLKDNFGRLEEVGDYIEKHIDPATGLVRDLSGGSGPYLYGIIDWPATMRYGYDMSTSMRTVINAYAYMDFDILSRIAQEIDLPEQSLKYQHKAFSVKSAMNGLLVNADGLYVDGLSGDAQQSKYISQHANVFPVSMGIATEENPDVLLDAIKAKKMSMGMVTMRWLPEAIGKMGDGPHLLDLYTREDWDGWAKSLSRGATMTWESWDAPETGQSLSHPWGAVGLLGIQQYMLGVKAIEPQFAKVQIKPLDFEGGLEFANGVVPSDRGDIKVDWKRTAEEINMTIEIPDNVTAEVYLPAFDSKSDQVTADGSLVTGTIQQDHVYVGTYSSGLHQFELRK